MDSRQISVYMVVAFILIISEVERGVMAQEVTSDMPMPTKLGDTCDMSEQCFKMANSECKSHKCVCKSDYKEDDKKTSCMKVPTKLGDTCDMSEQCSKMANSECKSHKCVCKSDYKEDGNKTNCMKGAGVQTFVSVSCLVLAMMVKLAV